MTVTALCLLHFAECMLKIKNAALLLKNLKKRNDAYTCNG